jgi:ribosome-associated protein
VKVKLPVVRVIEVTGEFIKLDSLLKLAGIVMTGGEAKVLIADGAVTVNGDVTTERGRKLRDGALIRANGQTVRIAVKSAAETV